MKAATANLLNALVLIAAGLYGYFGIKGADGNSSITALIPAFFGLLFLILHKGVASANKIAAHVVVLLTIFLLGMCVGRFIKVPEWNEKKFIFLACILSNLIATIAFVKSFIDARKARKAVN